MQGRKRNRKLDYDYSQDAIYFITINSKNKIHHFGKIRNGKMELNEFGKVAETQILWLSEKYLYFEMHNFVVMPNHLHLLFRIDSVKIKDENVKIKSVSSLVAAFKMTVSKEINLLGENDFDWQRSFHDHIVRSEKSYINIDNYITNNPENWDKDKYYGV